jgi:hypothetical protein
MRTPMAVNRSDVPLHKHCGPFTTLPFRSWVTLQRLTVVRLDAFDYDRQLQLRVQRR